jgi:hypothetical protein
LLSIKEFSRASDIVLSLQEYYRRNSKRLDRLVDLRAQGFITFFSIFLAAAGRPFYIIQAPGDDLCCGSRRASESSCFSWCCLSLSLLCLCVRAACTPTILFIYIMNERDFIPPDASYICRKKSRGAHSQNTYTDRISPTQLNIAPAHAQWRACITVFICWDAGCMRPPMWMISVAHTQHHVSP